MRGGWVYIMTNRPNGKLHVGVTSHLQRRIWEHREGVIQGFAKTYNLKRLVYFEEHSTINNAIQRGKTIKHWPRAWKLRLILEVNSGWADLCGLFSSVAAWMAGSSPAMTVYVRPL